MKVPAITNNGFTLVELIVVITILAILGTIGFLSLQGYSSQSRDSKRTSDIRSISTQITAKSAEGMSLVSLVGDNSSKSTMSRAIGGVYLSLLGANEYTAGIPAYAALGLSNKFKDTSSDYRIGASTRNGGIFQVAATLENSDGVKTAAVVGNYAPRTNMPFSASGTANGSSGATLAISNLTGSGIAFFEKGDTVLLDCTGANDGTATILSVAADGKSFTVMTTSTAANGAVLNVSLGDSTTYANFHELAGLVGAVGALGTQIVTDKGTNLPY